MKEKIILIGGGGHCRACIDVIEQEGRFTIAGIVDIPEKKQQTVLGYPVIGADADLARLIKSFPNVLITLGHIKSPTRRMELFNDLQKMGARFPLIQSPLAYVSPHAHVAEGTIVMHHALINAGARVGKNCIINTKALIEHDAQIGDHCHIAPAAVISGGVKIGQETFFGGKAMTREYVTIGEGSIVGGGGGGVERFASIQCLQRPIKIAILGASGFSRETADVALIDQIEELIFIDLDTTSNTYYGFPLLPEENVRDLEKEGFLFAIGLGDSATRKKIYSKFKTLKYPNLIHPSASLGYKQQSQLALTRGNIITSGVRFTNNIQIGNFGIFNLNSTVGHDCCIEDFVNISPGVNVSGNVHLKEGAYIGTNAAILQGKSINDKLIIGEYATIGAGALVLKAVESFDTVVGIPARSIRNE